MNLNERKLFFSNIVRKCGKISYFATTWPPSCRSYDHPMILSKLPLGTPNSIVLVLLVNFQLFFEILTAFRFMAFSPSVMSSLFERIVHHNLVSPQILYPNAQKKRRIVKTKGSFSVQDYSRSK